LAQTLRTLGRYPTIPPKFLHGELVGQQPPLPMVAPQIDGLKSPADFWTAMGNQLRASFTVTVTISVPMQDDLDASLVTTVRAGYGMAAGVEETIVSVGGTVRDNAGQPIASAVVSVLDAGLREETDVQGRFRFERIAQGPRQFRVSAVGFQTLTRPVTIPGTSGDYVLVLTPL
jgi:carboxypeptidase family protein